MPNEKSYKIEGQRGGSFSLGHEAVLWLIMNVRYCFGILICSSRRLEFRNVVLKRVPKVRLLGYNAGNNLNVETPHVNTIPHKYTIVNCCRALKHSLPASVSSYSLPGPL